MLQEDQNLNSELKDAQGDNAYSAEEIERVATRTGFGEGLVQAGIDDENVVGLCADLTTSVKMAPFAEKFPERFVQVGVAEQNLVTVASGLAASGKIPFTASYAMFSPGRNWEQIRTTICYNDVPVKIVGAHAGVSVGPDGGTHQAIEDIAIMRTIPNMDVVYPCDSVEAKKTTEALAKTGRPGYIRLAREKSVVMTTDKSPFELGKANVLFDTDEPDAVIFACGPLVYHALRAAKSLLRDKVKVSVVNVHTIKPLDKETIISFAEMAGAVVTVEEHQIMGGFGSAVNEVLAVNHPVPVEFVGVDDQFGQSGSPAELVEHYGLGVDSIIEKVKKVIKRK